MLFGKKIRDIIWVLPFIFGGFAGVALYSYLAILGFQEALNTRRGIQPEDPNHTLYLMLFATFFAPIVGIYVFVITSYAMLATDSIWTRLKNTDIKLRRGDGDFGGL